MRSCEMRGVCCVVNERARAKRHYPIYD
jgi:hypothetical protein